MKKISTLMLLAGLSSFVFAQEGNAFSRSFNNSKQPTEQNTDPGGGGDTEGPDSAPIDDYIPVLVVAGIGMAVYFGKKKYMLTDK